MLGALAALATAGLSGACSLGGAGGEPPGNAPLVYGSNGNVVTLTLDGKARRQLTKASGGAQARDPQWSADGKRIMYAYSPPLPIGRGPGGLVPLPVTDVYVMNADGSDQKVLFAHEAPGVAYETPVWAPDGKSVYVTYTELVMQDNILKDQLLEVARLDAGGGARQTLVRGAAFPTLSADGRRLACIASVPEGQALVVCDADGKNQRTLVPAGRMEGLASPSFSPDGKSIVFSAIAAMAPLPAPTPPPGRSAPASPTPGPRAGAADTLARAVQSMAGALGALAGAGRAAAHGLPMDVFVIPADGQAEPQRLTQLGEDNPAATWSPDGSRLAIIAGGGVYTLNADGSGFANVDQIGGHGSVDWK